jgi:hypothetical protein
MTKFHWAPMGQICDDMIRVRGHEQQDNRGGAALQA